MSNHSSRTPSPTAPPRGTEDNTRLQPKFVSVPLSIVGSVKRRITTDTNAAKQLLVELKDCVVYFVDPDITADNFTTETLGSAVSLLQKCQKMAHRLQGIQPYAERKLACPEMDNCSERDTHIRSIQEALSTTNPKAIWDRFDKNIGSLEVLLTKHGAQFTPFVPTDGDEQTDTEETPILTMTMAEDRQQNMPTIQQQPASSSVRAESQGDSFALINTPVNMSAMYSDDFFDYEKLVALNNEAQARLLTQVRQLTEENLELKRAKQEALGKVQETHTRSGNLTTLLDHVRGEEESQRPPETQPLLIDFPAFTKPSSVECMIPKLTQKATDPPTATITSQLMAEAMQLFTQMNQTTPSKQYSKEPKFTLPSNNHISSSHETDSEYEKMREDYYSDSDDEPMDENPKRKHCYRRKGNRSSQTRIQHPPQDQMKLENVLRILPSFDGTGDLDQFIAHFETNCMSRKDINDAAKNAVLTQHLVGSARNCIALYSDFEKATKMTIASLQKVFGKANDKHKLLEKFQTLPFDQSDPEKMRSDLNAHALLLGQLRDKGAQENDTMSTKSLVEKLPPTMLSEIARFMSEKRKIGEEATLDELIERIDDEIEAYEMEYTIIRSINKPPLNEIPIFGSVNVTHTKRSEVKSNQFSSKSRHGKTWILAYDASKCPPTYQDPVTKETLEGYYAPGQRGVNVTAIHRTFPFKNDEDVTCDACQGKHHSVRCKLSSTEFRARCKELGLCPLCAKKGHDISQCQASHTCIYCDGPHHVSGCPQKEHYRNKNHYPIGALPIVEFFRPRTHNKRF